MIPLNRCTSPAFLQCFRYQDSYKPGKHKVRPENQGEAPFPITPIHFLHAHPEW